MGIELSVADLWFRRLGSLSDHAAMMKYSATLTGILLLGVAVLRGAQPVPAQTANEMNRPGAGLSRRRCGAGRSELGAFPRSLWSPATPNPAAPSRRNVAVEIIFQKRTSSGSSITGAGCSVERLSFRIGSAPVMTIRCWYGFLKDDFDGQFLRLGASRVGVAGLQDSAEMHRVHCVQRRIAAEIGRARAIISLAVWAGTGWDPAARRRPARRYRLVSPSNFIMAALVRK